MAEATERERIAYDLFAICMQASVAMSDAAKAGEPKAGGVGFFVFVGQNLFAADLAGLGLELRVRGAHRSFGLLLQ